MSGAEAWWVECWVCGGGWGMVVEGGEGLYVDGGGGSGHGEWG